MNNSAFPLKTAFLLASIFCFSLFSADPSPQQKIDEQAELEKEVLKNLEKQGIKQSNAPAPAPSKPSGPTKKLEDKGKYVVEVVEEEIKDEPKKEEKKEFNLNTAEIYALKQEYISSREESSTNPRAKMIEIIKKYLADAEAEYEQKKKSGNVKGMAMAREAKTLFASCLEDMEKKAKFVPPEKFRKDLTDLMDKFTAELTPLLDETKNAETALAETFSAKFAETAKPQIEDMKLDAESAEKLIKEKFEQFVKEEIKAPEAPKTSTGTGGASKEADSPIIASRGGAENWVDVGEWSGEMYGMDVVNIPLNVQNDVSEKQMSPMTGEESVLNYKLYYPLPPRSDYAMRLMKIKDKHAPDIIEWPTPANNMTFTVRTKPIAKMPAPHGFLLQASLPPKEMAKVFNKAEFDKRMALKAPGNAGAGSTSSASGAKQGTAQTVVGDTKKNSDKDSVKVSFSSKPDGAHIYLDNFMLSDQRGSPCVTPCVSPVSMGKHEVKFIKLGYQDKILADFNVSPKNSKIAAELVVDPKLKSKKLGFGASTSSAKQTGISVVKGERISVDASGVWASGEKGEKCGASGYENNQKFFKYYLDKAKDARLTEKSLYGALLFKIGKDGDYIQAATGKEFVADRDGEIYIDINEKPEQRKGNSGSLDVSIIVFPAGASK